VAADKGHALAEGVQELLRSGRVGHVATISPTGRVSSVPVAYHFDGSSVFFGTPRDSPKLRFMEANENVAFQIDNGRVMQEAVGVMIQGNAEIYDTRQLLTKYRETLPAIARFSKKYPDVFVFYTRDHSRLPDERKFYKYRLVRIVPTSILYWVGYDWGRLIPHPEDYARFFEIGAEEGDPEAVADELQSFLGGMSTLETASETEEEVPDLSQVWDLPAIIDQEELMAELHAVAMADDEITSEEMAILDAIRSSYRFYLDALKNAMSDGIITKDELALLHTIKQSVYRSVIDTALKDGKIDDDERRLLTRFAELLNVSREDDAAGDL
jgi:nitroimidazol reductase NimA-like FMN-containing flavoprotein (pyridoxamine 5'-phosphate oxidase superfamily)